MREIKFRAWDGNQWSYFTIGQTMTDWMRAVYDDHCLHGRQFFQSTGLKDKNGVDIYEGDVLSVCKNMNGFFEVKFKNQYVGGWLLCHKKENEISLGARSSTELEVIGNIYENPELLNEKD